MEIYNIVNQNKNARIIRNLCIIRTEIERGFKHINEKMKYDFRRITSMPEHISQDSIQQLMSKHVTFGGKGQHEVYLPTTGMGRKTRRDRRKCGHYHTEPKYCSKIRNLSVGPTLCKEYSPAKATRKGTEQKREKLSISCTDYPRCQEIAYVEARDVNKYFYRHGGTGQHCPRCNYSLESKPGKYGVYIQCCGSQKHRFKLDEI